MMTIEFHIEPAQDADSKAVGKLNNALYSLGYRLMEEKVPFDDSFVRDSKERTLHLVFTDYEGDVLCLEKRVERIAKNHGAVVVNEESISTFLMGETP